MLVTLQGILIIFDFVAKHIGKNIKYLCDKYLQNDLEDDEDQPLADYDEERGVVFIPSVCSQRYSTVMDVLKSGQWKDKLKKVVDLGCHDTSFIKILKNIETIDTILGVDLELTLESCSRGIGIDNTCTRINPLSVKLYRGNAGDPDVNLLNTDAVICIELIEHMLPQDLEHIVHNIFGYVRPWLVVVSTPNGEFNVLFKNLLPNGFRRLDHFFEWTREQFMDWANNIVIRYADYTVKFAGIGPGPPGTEYLGHCTQMAVFHNPNYPDRMLEKTNKKKSKFIIGDSEESQLIDSENINGPRNYKLVKEYCYPIPKDVDDQEILDVIFEIFQNIENGKSDLKKLHFDKLMESVEGLTNDRNRVRDLLEWNGYEVTEFNQVIKQPTGVIHGANKSDSEEDGIWL